MKVASSYRADIDGLRAVAVLAVVLFHLHVRGLSGGYVGVDVFFVISGYLITGLIEAELARGAFTLRGFYLRRIRRLAPALVVVSTAATVAAVITLYPEDMRSFSASLATQFVSLQNFFFLSDGEYFRNADTKLLLHTWTLAVEEQFYLVWPLFLLLTRKATFRWRLVLVALVMLASFLLNLALMRISPKASFFLLPPRAWELATGGVIALLQGRRFFDRVLTPARRAAAGFIGLAAILVSAGMFSADTPFPGRAALLPVVGAALVIIAGIGGNHPVGRLLSNRGVVHVGLISYPMYLWHWPLIALAHHVRRDPARPLNALAIVALSFALAELTYRFVESPIRDRKWLPTPRALLLAALPAAACLTAFGIHGYATDGAAYRFPPEARGFLTASFSASGQRCGLVFRIRHPNAQVCALHVVPSSERRVLIWGNSHGDMWSEMMVELGKEHGASVYLNTRNCRATPDSDFCGPHVQEAVLAFIESERVTDVVLASSWYGLYDVPDGVFERTLEDVVTKLTARKVRIWLVIDTPSSPNFDPVATYERNPHAPSVGVLPVSDYAPVRDRERALFASIAAAHPAVAILEPSTALCEGTVCSGGKENEVWYRDPDHVTNAGARAARAVFAPVFNARRE